jgi:hypothetical protein
MSTPDPSDQNPIILVAHNLGGYIAKQVSLLTFSSRAGMNSQEFILTHPVFVGIFQFPIVVWAYSSHCVPGYTAQDRKSATVGEEHPDCRFIHLLANGYHGRLLQHQPGVKKRPQRSIHTFIL